MFPFQQCNNDLLQIQLPSPILTEDEEDEKSATTNSKLSPRFNNQYKTFWKFKSQNEQSGDETNPVQPNFSVTIKKLQINEILLKEVKQKINEFKKDQQLQMTIQKIWELRTQFQYQHNQIKIIHTLLTTICLAMIKMQTLINLHQELLPADTKSYDFDLFQQSVLGLFGLNLKEISVDSLKDELQKIFEQIVDNSSQIDINKLKIVKPNPTQQRLLEELAIFFPLAYNKLNEIRPLKTASLNNRLQKIELPQLNDIQNKHSPPPSQRALKHPLTKNYVQTIATFVSTQYLNLTPVLSSQSIASSPLTSQRLASAQRLNSTAKLSIVVKDPLPNIVDTNLQQKQRIFNLIQKTDQQISQQRPSFTETGHLIVTKYQYRNQENRRGRLLRSPRKFGNQITSPQQNLKQNACLSERLRAIAQKTLNSVGQPLQYTLPVADVINSSSFTDQIIKNMVNTSSVCPPFKLMPKSNLIGLCDSKAVNQTQQRLLNSAVCSPRAGKNNLNMAV